MKILVLSDSHAALSFMRQCIRKLKPDAVVHLGDFYQDGEAMAEEFSHIPFHQVPGNCDYYRVQPPQPEILCYEVCGVRLYMTHGHRHGVKAGLYRLIPAAREANAQAVLYGHTHVADCHKDGNMWVLNPGSCGYYGGSAGVVETDGGEISACYLLDSRDIL